ncbi:hypothetical protein [uncultured Fibrobacter sp.]|uniref:hypothetical protein n=1 Tax=uncultured Fibrobacter sp. TaxID=261512 RepID=UPI0025D8A01D|nr:hypothetical protein [uncultured Fibrobacter sp.]
MYKKKEETKPVKIQASAFTLEDHKKQLTAWIEAEHIPGKFQAWYTAPADPMHSDWRIKSVYKGQHELLEVEVPVRKMDVPEIVPMIFQQLRKEHLRAFRKSIRQIWLRATGDGRFAMLVQANLRGRNSAHESKTFTDFVQRSIPEILSLHFIQCKPDHLFDPATAQTVSTEAKCVFGKDFMPIADTGFSMHVLDWAPRVKDAWIGLPKRIADAIHPTKGDRLFEFYSASSYVGASLASMFDSVDCLDCRETAMLSSKYNARALVENNMRFHRQKLDANFFAKFFRKPENEGRWTFYFNLPGDEPLATGVVQTAAASRPERILLQTSNLEVAAKEIRKFRNEGYMLRKSVPLYLEPGSAKFEVLFIFVPDRNGLLGRNTAILARSKNVQRPKERIERAKKGNIPHFVQKDAAFRSRKD